MSQFSANLNLINPMYGTAEPIEDAFDQSNLDLFANADFFDWDMGQSIHTALGGNETDRDVDKKMETSTATSLDVFSSGDATLDSKSIIIIIILTVNKSLGTDTYTFLHPGCTHLHAHTHLHP